MMNMRVTTLEFKEWVKSQAKNFTYVSEPHEHFTYNSNKCRAEIGFYYNDIVELEVKTNDNKPVYYLHFQVHSLNTAKQYLSDMLEALNNYEKKQPYEILICCSNGATSSFFAEKLNKAESILDFGYHFTGCGYATLYQKADNFNMVVIAPQLAYRYKEILERLGDKVKKVPAKVFASYKVKNMLDFIETVK